jgi:flagellar FliJ protein
MARFVFQLDGVLRQRKLVEEQKQRDLAVLEGEMKRLESQLRELDESVGSTTADVRDNRLTGRLDLSFLAAHRRYTLAVQRKAVTLAEQMAAVKLRVNSARQALAEAAKQRKIIEKLREKRYAEWAAEQSRKEMAALDEVGMRIGYEQGLLEAASDGDPTAAEEVVLEFGEGARDDVTPLEPPR